MSYNSSGVDRYAPDFRLERLETDVARFGVELRALNDRVAHLEARETAELDRRTRRRENIDNWVKIFAAVYVGVILGLAITH